MASWLLGSFPRAPSATTGLYVTRALWHKTKKLSIASPQNNLNPHFKSIEARSKHDKCERKYFMNATSKEPYESEPPAPISRSILESIKDAMDITRMLTRPYMMIPTVLGILSASFLAVENLSDLSPAFFIGLFQSMVASLCMLVYHCASNDLADVEIDKINRPHQPMASRQYSSRAVVIVTAAFLFMSVSIGWLVGSWPIRWGLLNTFILATAYTVNLPFLRWKRFTSLTLVYSIGHRLISIYLAPFLHMKTHVLKRIAIYPRSMIFALAINAVHTTVISLAKDLPDIEGDKEAGIQTLAVRFGPERVFWLCVSLLEMGYGVAILIGAAYPSLWSKIVMVSTHAIMALVLWCNAKSIDLKNKAACRSFSMTLWKLLSTECIIIALAR